MFKWKILNIGCLVLSPDSLWVFWTLLCLWHFLLYFLSVYVIKVYRRSQWPHGLRRRFAATRLLRLWVRIPPGAWMSVCCECWVLSGRGHCDGLITRPEEPYRLWYVVVCDLETSWIRRPWPTGGCRPKNKQIKAYLWLIWKDKTKGPRLTTVCKIFLQYLLSPSWGKKKMVAHYHVQRSQNIWLYPK